MAIRNRYCTNINNECLIFAPGEIETQPPLSGVEIALLNAINQAGKVNGLLPFVEAMGLGYAHAIFCVKRLEVRGLVAMRKNGYGLVIEPRAEYCHYDA